MQSFLEVLADGTNFKLDRELGVWRYVFGEGDRYSLELESWGMQFGLALYDKGFYGPDIKFPELMWQSKLPVKPGYTIPTGPGVEQEARRKAIREWLVKMLADLDQADQEAAQAGKHD